MCRGGAGWGNSPRLARAAGTRWQGRRQGLEAAQPRAHGTNSAPRQRVNPTKGTPNGKDSLGAAEGENPHPNP